MIFSFSANGLPYMKYAPRRPSLYVVDPANIGLYILPRNFISFKYPFLAVSKSIIPSQLVTPQMFWPFSSNGYLISAVLYTIPDACPLSPAKSAIPLNDPSVFLS